MPTEKRPPSVAIVDYGMGNLFSVKQACEYAGLAVVVTELPADLAKADAVILPGVGAFGGAMESLNKMGLVEVLQEIAATGKPLLGICLGAQLLMSEGFEFGQHQGLGIVDGTVTPLGSPTEGGSTLKVPQVGWNSIYSPTADVERSWDGTLLRGVNQKEFMYFVHSFVMQPSDPDVVISSTHYGDVEFCSGYRQGNVHAFQFHPERSGPAGLQVYQNLASLLTGNSAGSKPSEQSSVVSRG